MEYFVKNGSIVREIWGKGDTILFIFAGASAEFALNKAVDWLFFTGKLPSDPLGRLFSTVTYARMIVFSDTDAAYKAIDKITAIHSAVEKNRGASIPDWAYRDVLFMLIHYSIASYEVLERRLTDGEKEEVFNVFYRFGTRMNLRGLPANYLAWISMRKEHLRSNLDKSILTIDLYEKYKKHLGTMRYKLLLEGQKLVVPAEVYALLQLRKFKWMRIVMPLYKLTRRINMDWIIKAMILPRKYKSEIQALDVQNES